MVLYSHIRKVDDEKIRKPPEKIALIGRPNILSDNWYCFTYVHFEMPHTDESLNYYLAIKDRNFAESYEEAVMKAKLLDIPAFSYCGIAPPYLDALQLPDWSGDETSGGLSPGNSI